MAWTSQYLGSLGQEKESEPRLAWGKGDTYFLNCQPSKA